MEYISSFISICTSHIFIQILLVQKMEKDWKVNGIHFLFYFNLYIPQIYTNTPSTKNGNFPNLILWNPFDYRIVLILSLITKI